LNEGLQDFNRVAKRLTPHNGTGSYSENDKYLKNMGPDWGTRLEDKTIGDLVIAAHAGKHAKLDLFNLRVSNVSLYEAVVGWQQTLFANAGSAVKGEDLSFLSTSGGERSWSWTEYFIFNFPNDERTRLLREMNQKIFDKSHHGYIGLATGPSSCLLRLAN